MAESDEQEGVDMNEGKAAEQAGEQFDKIYYYDNSHNNIYSALNLKDDD